MARLFKLELLVVAQVIRITRPRDSETSINVAAARCLADTEGRPILEVTEGSGFPPMVAGLRVKVGSAKRRRNVWKR